MSNVDFQLERGLLHFDRVAPGDVLFGVSKGQPRDRQTHVYDGAKEVSNIAHSWRINVTDTGPKTVGSAILNSGRSLVDLVEIHHVPAKFLTRQASL